MKIRLDEEINKLRKCLLEMGNAVEDQLGLSIKALKERDAVLAKQVIRNDAFVNRLEVKIDKICLKIFALKQPIAIDLRFVASSLKVNNDLERMGDFACRIAEDVISLTTEHNFIELEEIFKLTELSKEMVKKSLESFMQRDIELAQKIMEQDAEVDANYEAVIKRIGPYVHEDSERFETGLAYIDIAKSIERIGDHSVNICENAIYLSKGEIVKHRSSY